MARGMTDIVSVQNRYNVGDRQSEAVLDECSELGIAFLPWAPLSGGQLDTESCLTATCRPGENQSMLENVRVHEVKRVFCGEWGRVIET